MTEVSSALGRLYEDERDGLVRLSRFVTGSAGAADEIVQDAFADLQEIWATVERPAAWLQRAVARRSVSWVRRRRTAERHLQSVSTETAVVTGPDVAERIRVADAVRRLTPERRAVVFCRYYLDLSEKATADLLGIRPGTVKSRLSRALVDLEGALSDR